MPGAAPARAVRSCTAPPGRGGRALRGRRLLPAIYFVFSRAGCDEAVRHCLDAGFRLTDARGAAPDPRDRRGARRDALRRGPLGARLPELRRRPRGRRRRPPRRARAAVPGGGRGVLLRGAREGRLRHRDARARDQHARALGRHRGALEVRRHGHQELTPGEYTQLTGRAGRRGIDEVGYAAVLWSPFHSFDDVARSPAARRTCALVFVPADLQHGRQPRPPLHPTSRLPARRAPRSPSS